VKAAAAGNDGAQLRPDFAIGPTTLDAWRKPGDAPAGLAFYQLGLSIEASLLSAPRAGERYYCVDFEIVPEVTLLAV